MADIKPFRAWKYNSILSENLRELTAPLSESVLKQRQEAFYKLPYHHYHVSSPIDVPPFDNASRRVSNWKLDGVIRPDSLPGIYVYEQNFCLKSRAEECNRIGIIAFIKAEDFGKKVVLPHEKTILKAVEYRSSLLNHTRIQTTPTHGFYSDPEESIETYLKESISNPFFEFVDKQDTIHKVSVIQDYEIIQHIIRQLKNHQVWIADGHHRYESSVRLRAARQDQNEHHRGDEAYNYHMMWLTNTYSSDLGLLPTHRLVHSIPNFNPPQFLKNLEAYFVVQPTPYSEDFGLAPIENLWTFKLLFASEHYILKLKPEAFQHFEADMPELIKKLDISVMHYFILEKTLGLVAQEQFDYLDFSQYYTYCLKQVEKKKANFALITRRVTKQEIEEVCQNGYTMPAKSTYFFPKVLGGLLFGSIQEEEAFSDLAFD